MTVDYLRYDLPMLLSITIDMLLLFRLNTDDTQSEQSGSVRN